MDANPDEAAALREMGYVITSDEQLAAAAAVAWGVRPDLARRALAGTLSDLVVTEEPPRSA